MIKTLKLLSVAGVLGLAVAACSSNTPTSVLPLQTPVPTQTVNPNPTNPPVPLTTYSQVEFLAKPAIKEVFEAFNNHATSNAAEPYADAGLRTSIISFMDAVRPSGTTGQDSVYATTLASVLYPATYSVDLTQTTGGYLGVESGGLTGGKFGGRLPADDVINLSLGAIFGKTLTALGVPDDGKESNCLAAENVTINTSQAPSGSFPYLAGPH